MPRVAATFVVIQIAVFFLLFWWFHLTKIQKRFWKRSNIVWVLQDTTHIGR